MIVKLTCSLLVMIRSNRGRLRISSPRMSGANFVLNKVLASNLDGASIHSEDIDRQTCCTHVVRTCGFRMVIGHMYWSCHQSLDLI